MRQTVLSIVAAAFLCGTAIAAPEPGPVPPPENRVLAHDILKELVAIPTTHDKGTRMAANAIVARLRAAGFTEIHEIADPAFPHQVNVVVRLKGQGKGKPVLWHGHLDVVRADPADWSVPPYTLTERDGYFYGRGTSDMKDQDAAMLASLIRLKQEGFAPARDIIVAFTADEEVGENEDGFWYLLRAHRDLADAEMAINTDGQSGEIVNGKRDVFGISTSEKTYATFTLETINRGGHSSEPRPDNAIYQLAQGLLKLSQYQFPYKTNATTRAYLRHAAEKESGQRRSDMLTLAEGTVGQPADQAAAARLARDVPLNAILHTTCVATMLSGGHQDNALAQRATATVQCRLFPGETAAETAATLARVVDDPGIKVARKGMVIEAPESPPTPALLSTVGKVVETIWPGTKVVPMMAAGASDSIFSRNAGIPSYGISGGWIDIHDIRAHGRDERMSQAAFYEGVEFTYRLMKALTAH